MTLFKQVAQDIKENPRSNFTLQAKGIIPLLLEKLE